MKNVAIVAPVHIQVSEAWVNALKREQDKADIIIVDDSDGKVSLPEDWEVYDYASQKEALGDELYAMFEQFHHSSACKNFGTWLAYKKGYEYIIVIDSDCVVPKDFIQSHINYLESQGEGWANPLDYTGYHSRGFPYSKRKIEKWAHMGLWENELDLYGTDRVGKTNIPRTPAVDVSQSNGAFFPLSGMNVSFKREAVPYMLFLPNFKVGEYSFSRHDDIWGGYIFEKIAQIKNKALSFGKPWVFHDTVVIPEEDAAEEVAMIKFEDDFYDVIDNVFAYPNTWREQSQTAIFEYLATYIAKSDLAPLASAFTFWSEVFKD